MTARFFHIAFSATLLAGCAAYSGEDWPDLSQGFDGAYGERRSSSAQPDVISDPEVAGNLPRAISNDLLQDNFSALRARVMAQRDIYETVKAQAQAEADAQNADGENINWLTAQFELTRLSQLAEELLELAGPAGSFAGPSSGNKLAGEISDFRTWLEQYIADERIRVAELA